MRRRLPILALLALVALPAAAFWNDEKASEWESVFFTPASARRLAFAPDVTIFATNRGIYYATNQRRFRRASLNAPGGAEIVDLAMLPGLPDIYALTSSGYLLRSTDRGRKFSLIGQFPETRVSGLALAGDGTLYVASSAGVMVSNRAAPGASSDGGHEFSMPWESIVLALPIWRQASLGSDSELWSGWSVCLSGVCLRLAAVPGDTGHVFAEIFRDGWYESRDRGASWQQVSGPSGERLQGPIAFGPAGEVMIGLNLLRAGDTWQALPLRPDTKDLRQSNDAEFALHAALFAPDGIWALNYRAAAVYASADGIIWRRRGEPEDFAARSRETSPSHLAVDPAGVLWVATDGHGLFRLRGGSSGVDK